MDRTFRILAAVDFSESAHRAFDQAVALSRQYGAELSVVHAVPAEEPFGWRGRERSALLEQLRRKAGYDDVRFSARVQHGDPAEIILLHAGSVRPDLIVLGTQQRAGVERLRSASVAHHVALHAKQPVLIVPPGPAGAPVSSFHRVAVAVDFGIAATRAVEHALALADPGGRVTLVHVVPGSFAGAVPRHMYRFGAVEYQKLMTGEAWRRLHKAMPPVDPARAAVHARVLLGDAHDGITRAAAELDADVIVVGVSDRNALSRAILGTVAGRLLRTVNVPLLTIPEAVLPLSAPVARPELARAA